MEELRALTLQMAIQFAVGCGPNSTVEDVINVAKRFESHITGSGITVNITPPMPAERGMFR